MSAPTKQPANGPNPDYQQAEQFIDRSLANMNTDSHIEYTSTMERNQQPSKWKLWLNRILRLHN